MRTPILALSSLLIASSLVTEGIRAQDPAPGRGRGQDQGQDATDDAGRATEPQRVVLRVNRTETVDGTVQLEDDNVVVVRTPQNELVSLPKTRILQIVRLVDPPPGGQPGLVIMLDGQVRDGIVMADDYDAVLVKIEGITARIRRQVVDHVVLRPTFLERYELITASIGPDDVDRHLVLCQWLFDEKAYLLAAKELRELLSRHEHPEARRLLTVVEAQQMLEEAAGTHDDTAASTTAESPAVPATLPGRVLTDEEVNLIRVYEIDFRAPPRLAIRPETTIAFLETYAQDPRVPASRADRDRFARADPLEVARFMFELRARDFYGGIDVLSEPYALNLFREDVHNRWLMNSCSTTRCHGNPDTGGMFLRYRNHRDPRVRYANLLTLERLEVALPSGAPVRLVNYDNPAESLILQYGLPRSDARNPHPDVPGWEPVFRGLTDRMARDTLRWIDAMYRPRPEYPVDFDPPRPWNEARADESDGPPAPRQDR